MIYMTRETTKRTATDLNFTRQQWFSLPLALRQRWWKETNYGKLEPSPELAEEIEKVLAEQAIR